MKKLIVFLDYESNYYDRVERIKEDAKNEVEYYYLEDYLKIKDKIKDEDVIYFLTNVKEIINIVEDLPNNKILNKDYYLSRCSKVEVQEKLLKNGIDTPTIIKNIDNLANRSFPLYVKNKNHDVFVAKVCSKRSFNYMFNKFDINDFYLEEEIKNKDIIKEHKIYYANKSVFENDEDIISDRIKETCHKLGAITGLDVYSADLIETKDKVYVIDVNSAPGFWYSRDSRLKLLEFCN